MAEQHVEKWRLTLTRHQDTLQAWWSADDWEETYTAPLDRVIQKSLSVRDTLRHLNEFAHANHQSDEAWQGNEFKSLIYDMQQEGEDLYLALLSSDDPQIGELIKSRIAQAGRLELSITVNKR